MRYNIGERQVLMMATKSATVTARVQPEIKQKAEEILSEIGIPVSVAIDTLYRQIIMTGGLPYQLTVPGRLQTRDSMTTAEFDSMMETGYRQAKNRQGVPLEEAFEQISRGL